MDFTKVRTQIWENKSFNLLGWDWDELVADEYMSWDQTRQLDDVPLLSSETLQYDTSQNADYTIKYEPKGNTETRIDTASRVSHNGNIYKYAGPVNDKGWVSIYLPSSEPLLDNSLARSMPSFR